MVVERPDAAVSKAWRGGTERRELASAGGASANGELRLTSGVIVRVAHHEDLVAVAAGSEIEPVLPRAGVLENQNRLPCATRLRWRMNWQTPARFCLPRWDVEWPWVTREIPNDPFLDEQWHLINALNPAFDVNADAAWDLGYTGAGGCDGAWSSWHGRIAHPDLAANFQCRSIHHTQRLAQLACDTCGGRGGGGGKQRVHGARELLTVRSSPF